MTNLSIACLIAGLLSGAAVLARADGKSGGGPRVLADVPYLEPDRKERLDLYLPARAERPAPAVVWIHGGGWTSGDKAQAREKNVGAVLAGWGYVVASINYKMGAGAWPQNLEDCKNAVRFLRVHAAEYHLDPERIAVAGGSAGGHLALLLAFTAGRQWEPEALYPGVPNTVRAVVDFYGPTNHLTRQEVDARGYADGRPKLGNAVAVFVAGDATNLDGLRASSPVNQVDAHSPPVLIVHGLADPTVNHEQSEELAAVLARAGVPHELLLLPATGHTFDLETWNGKPLPRDVRTSVREFLERWLAPP